MKCPYCDSEFEMEALKQMDEELNNIPEDDMKWDTDQLSEWKEGETANIKEYICKSCGGEIIGDETLAASKCPYCDSPVVMKGAFAGDLRPDLVIPFKVDKKAAIEGLKKHVMGKKLLPKVFQSQNHIEEIRGIYVPVWTYDTAVDAKIHYKATKEERYSDKDYNYTKTYFYAVSRQGSLDFESVPADGSTKMDDTLWESIEPYKFKDAVEFQTAYLSGYLADKYDVEAKDNIERINTRVKQSTMDAIRATVTGYNTVDMDASSFKLTEGKIKYVLCPVWILNTVWNGQKYTFAMNGQTGKFVGDLPLDKQAYWRWFGILTAGVSAGVFLISMLATIM